MKQLLLAFFLIHMTLSFQATANQLLGHLDGSEYTDKNGVFVTELPTLNGELRDFPNAVSVYSVLSGAQDSLEYYPVTEEEQQRYRQQGAESYHSTFIRRALIEERYKSNFSDVTIVDEGLHNNNNQPFYRLLIQMPSGSQMTDKSGHKLDLWVALGTTIKHNRIFIYQIAVTNLERQDAETINRTLSDKILTWASKTEYMENLSASHLQ